jgi:hypothetical protein
MSIKKTFPNTFASNIENKEFTVDDIILMLSLGLVFDKLPQEVKQAVREELHRRHNKQYQIPPIAADSLSLENIINKLKFHEIQPSDLPNDIKQIVSDETVRRTNLTLEEWWTTYHAAKYKAKKEAK